MPVPESNSGGRAKQDKSFLDQLNAQQRKAVEKIFGTVLVVAGPGTGKTQLLTARITQILSVTDADPQNILCLTFTENGATQMRKRLSQWIGPAAYKVGIFTFHGFCEWVMRRYPSLFLQQRGRKEIADDLTKALIFRQVIDSKKWQYFKPFGDNYYWQFKFLKAVSNLKREGISSDQLRDMMPAEKAREEALPSHYYQRDSKYGKKGDMKPAARAKIDEYLARLAEFCDLWDVYDAEMGRQRVYDFDDQIAWTVEKIASDSSLKADLQEQFQFILVDEYQDTNSAQNQILWHLTDFFDDPNLFAVGDDDQSIFRFQGASIENMLAFEKKFPTTERIELVDNYRSAQKLLDGAYHSVAHNLERINHEKKLQAAGANTEFTGQIEKAIFTSRFSEIIHIADTIKKAIADGTSPSEIAILTRENREAKELATYLQKFGIPVAKDIFENIFTDGSVGWLIAMLRIFHDPTLDHVFLDFLHAPFLELDSHTLLELSMEARSGHGEIAQLLQKRSNESDSFKNVISLFRDGRQQFGHLPPAVVAEKLFHTSGLASFLARDENLDRVSDLLKVRKLIEWIERQTDMNLEQVLERIDLHLELGIAITPDPMPIDQRSIRILTAHRSKGSEFEIVFLPGLVDGVWGNRRKHAEIKLPPLSSRAVDETAPSHLQPAGENSNSRLRNGEGHDPNEEERRLFFVALTRAKKEIHLSYSDQDFRGRERTPAQFWHEIPDELCTLLESETVEQKAQELLPVFFATETPAFTENEKVLLRQLAHKFVWSATSLQNYLHCPRKFLYVNLLRVPTPNIRSKHLALGSAVHRALEILLATFRETKTLPEKQFLLEQFQQALKRQNLTFSEYEETLEHGQKLLSDYYDQRHAEFSPHVITELNFTDYHVKIDDIPATGRIDKVELSENGKRAIFVDYKSGKPKRIQSEDRLWRQLVFYDLLARNASLDFTVEQFDLEFLTPDKSGKYVRRILEITNEDRETVRAELKNAHQKLLNLEFPMVENFEGDPEIEYWQNFGR